MKEIKITRQTKNEERAERFKAQKESTLEKLYPKSHYRLANLKNGDEQINTLLNLLESQGMPLGSDQWGLYCAAYVRRLIDLEYILHSLIGDHENNKETDYEMVKLSMDHVRKMYIKRKPKFGDYECDYCGHHDAKLVTGTNSAICDSCQNDLNSQSIT